MARLTKTEAARQLGISRTTNRYGCVTLHSYPFYVESGGPQTHVLLWVYDEH
jgi:hypothetical protein